MKLLMVDALKVAAAPYWPHDDVMSVVAMSLLSGYVMTDHWQSLRVTDGGERLNAAEVAEAVLEVPALATPSFGDVENALFVAALCCPRTWASFRPIIWFVADEPLLPQLRQIVAVAIAAVAVAA